MHVVDFIGRGASVKGLCEAFLSGAPPHASLLAGPPGVGKRTLAYLLARSLHCAGEAPRPCGTCPGCKRVQAGSHPDAYCLRDEKRIGVDQVRTLIAALASSAYEGAWRSIVIEQADEMTPQAQNALLKTLEEPPPQTVFLLTATSASAVLPTILSRCRAVQLSLLSEAEVKAALLAAGVSAERARVSAAFSGGSVGLAASFAGDEAFWRLSEKLDQALAGLQKPGDILPAMNLLKDDKAEAKRACDLIEWQLSSALAATLGEARGMAGAWQKSLDRMDAKSLLRLLEQAMETRRMLSANVPWLSALERFLLVYMEELTKWQS